MKIFIYAKQPDGTYVKHFFAISELETILAHKRLARSKRLSANAVATQKELLCKMLQTH